ISTWPQPWTPRAGRTRYCARLPCISRSTCWRPQAAAAPIHGSRPSPGLPAASFTSRRRESCGKSKVYPPSAVLLRRRGSLKSKVQSRSAECEERTLRFEVRGSRFNVQGSKFSLSSSEPQRPAGLKVRAYLDTKEYPLKVKPSAQRLRELR